MIGSTRISIVLLLLSFTTLFAGYPDTTKFPGAGDVLNSLKPDHPRLYFDRQKIENLRNRARTDTFLSELIDHFIKRAQDILNEPPVDYILVGPRLLSQSRRCLDRVSTLALAYHLTNDELYLSRAKKELFAAASFPDWHPSHFLDTAELCMAFGVGYDWLYNDLTDDDKTIIRNALLEKGLKVGLDHYRNNAWWARNPFNWNQVCNGGLSVGALAIAEKEPEICAGILTRAIRNLPYAMNSYAPDGGWAEGPGYWGYASRYTVYMLAALQTALGTDYGLSEAPGFDMAGHFPVYCTGPLGLFFNFADAGSRSQPMSTFYWLANKFNQSLYASEQCKRLATGLRNGKAPNAMDIIWYQPQTGEPDLPKDKYYQGIQAVFLRSAWENPEALFIGFKGGDNQANHAHLDIGTFVLDAMGIRWALDYGRDDYNLPGYWSAKEGGQRWKYFRLNNRSHNTLTLNGDVQRANAKAPFVRREFTKNRSIAVADLSEAYLPHANKVLRGIALLDNKSVLIQDEIDWTGDNKNVLWNVTTKSRIEIDGNTAILHQNSKTMKAFILAPQNAVFDTLSAYREPPENPNKGFHRLVIRFDEKKDQTCLAVLFAEQKKDIKITPLTKW